MRMLMTVTLALVFVATFTQAAAAQSQNPWSGYRTNVWQQQYVQQARLQALQRQWALQMYQQQLYQQAWRSGNLGTAWHRTTTAGGIGGYSNDSSSFYAIGRGWSY